MSPSRLEVSDHAKERLKQRSITRQKIRECLAKGRISGVDLKGRRIAELKSGRKTLVVIYLEVTGGYLIVTAYWKGEL
jgi:hypothetical protein